MSGWGNSRIEAKRETAKGPEADKMSAFVHSPLNSNNMTKEFGSNETI